VDLTSEGRAAKPPRRIPIGPIAGAAVAVIAIVSLALVSLSLSTGSASAHATPGAAYSVSTQGTALGLDATASAPAGSGSGSPSPTPTPVRAPTVTEHFVAKGTEPTISADPLHPGVVAVVTQNIYMSSATVGCSRPTVRVSKDDGATWGNPSQPWNDQCQDIHAIIAWGPNGRLWAGDAMGYEGGVSMSVTHSDDGGLHWTTPFIERFTKPWSGCFPAIAVDTWPNSPNYGTVYVSYNWLPDSYGPGVAVMASRDGTNWFHTEVNLETLAGYPFSWRIGYRVKAAPDGTAWVSFYQSDLKSWSPNAMLWEGDQATNIGRMGFEIARIHFNGKTMTADQPYWATSVDHTEAQWDSGLAVDDSGQPWLAVETNGRIALGSPDGGWRQFEVSGKDSFKPSLAVSGKNIFVGWHAMDTDGETWTYYTLSYDGGRTFLPPARVTGTSWFAPTNVNGVGLRECADAANGVFYYAYGDNRSSGAGVYVAQIKP
jgi:hypothetical protein